MVANFGSEIEDAFDEINDPLASIENSGERAQKDLIETVRQESDAFKELILEATNYQDFFSSLNNYVNIDVLDSTDIGKYINLFNSKDQLAGLANQILDPSNLENFVKGLKIGDLEIFDLDNFGPVIEAKELWGQFNEVSNGIIGEGQNLMSSLGSMSELSMSGLGAGIAGGAISGMITSRKLSKMDKKLDAIIRELGVINQKLDKVLANQQIMISKLESIEAKVDSLLVLNMRNHKKEMAVLKDIQRRIMDVQNVLDQNEKEDWLTCQKVVVDYEAINFGNSNIRHLGSFERYFRYSDAVDDCEDCSEKLRSYYFSDPMGGNGEYMVSGDLNLLLYNPKYFYLDSDVYDNKLNKVKRLLRKHRSLIQSNQLAVDGDLLALLANPHTGPVDSKFALSNSIDYSEDEQIINLEHLHFLTKAVIYTRNLLLYKEKYMNGNEDRYLSILSEYRAFLDGLVNLVNKALIQENLTTGHLLLSLEDKNEIFRQIFDIPEINESDSVLLYNLGMAIGYQRYAEEELSRYKFMYYSQDPYIVESLFFGHLFELKNEGYEITSI
jgi:hypothetical protein